MISRISKDENEKRNEGPQQIATQTTPFLGLGSHVLGEGIVNLLDRVFGRPVKMYCEILLKKGGIYFLYFATFFKT